MKSKTRVKVCLMIVILCLGCSGCMRKKDTLVVTWRDGEMQMEFNGHLKSGKGAVGIKKKCGHITIRCSEDGEILEIDCESAGER